MTKSTGKSEIKVIGGKLIRAQVVVEDKIVTNVVITGDFFLHPEDGIENLEKELVMTKAEPETLRMNILNFFKRGYVMVGATPEDFAKVVLDAASQASVMN